jgi:hypothetical protein
MPQPFMNQGFVTEGKQRLLGLHEETFCTQPFLWPFQAQRQWPLILFTASPRL